MEPHSARRQEYLQSDRKKFRQIETLLDDGAKPNDSCRQLELDHIIDRTNPLLLTMILSLSFIRIGPVEGAGERPREVPTCSESQTWASLELGQLGSLCSPVSLSWCTCVKISFCLPFQMLESYGTVPTRPRGWSLTSERSSSQRILGPAWRTEAPRLLRTL